MNHILNLVNSHISSEERLRPFLFPVEERKAGYEDYPDQFFSEGRLIKTPEYKSIVRADNDKLISIMPKTYKLVSNEEVILPVLDFLNNFDNRWLVDDSHSFVSDGRMRLQITFPDLTVDDGDSDIALSLFIHNSYNGQEGVRGFWGGIRGICTNGMVFGKLLGSFYHRHTSGIDLEMLKTQCESTLSKLPVIEDRIKILQEIETNSKQLEAIEKHIGKKAIEYVNDNFQAIDSQYVLLNLLTYYISHMINKPQRATYQKHISNIFNI